MKNLKIKVFELIPIFKKQNLLKVVFLSLFLNSLATDGFSQFGRTDSVFGAHYKMIVETPIFLCNLIGSQLSDSLYEAPANSIITHVGNSGNNVIIRFWRWTEKDQYAIRTFNYSDSLRLRNLYFLMSKNDFFQKTRKRYSQKPIFTIGTGAIPFKIRTKPTVFTNDVGIGPLVGTKFRLSPYTNHKFFNALIGFGLSSVQLDSFATQGIITDNSLINNTAALTLSIGAVFEYTNIQIGIFIGKDYINGNKRINWIYQGKTWISLGVGYSLYTKSNANAISSAGKNTTPVVDN